MSVGARLQHARSERKLSLADVTEQTKIQPWVLEALEGDRLQELMSPIYVKGFLSSYARFLHLDPETLIAELRWPKAQAAQEELPPAPPAPAIAWRLPSVPWRRVGLVVAAAGIVLAIVKVEPGRPGRQAGTKPAAAKRASRPAPLNRPAEAAAPAKLAGIAPVAQALPAVAPPTLTLLASQPLELAVIAQRTTWIRIRADGKLLSQQRLQRGARERWTAKKRLEVVVSQPANVELVLNDQPISSSAIAHRGRLLITHHGVTRLPDDQ